MAGRKALPEAEKVARAERMKTFRSTLWKSQEEAAVATFGRADRRTYFVRYENGENALSTVGAVAPIARAAKVRPEDLFAYLGGDMDLEGLLATRGRQRTLNPDDPDDWAAIVRAIADDAGFDDAVVDSFLTSKAKDRKRAGLHDVVALLERHQKTMHVEGTEPPSDNPPFLKAKKRRR